MQYSTDLDELDAIMARLRGLVAFVDEQLPQIDTRVQQMHDPEGDGWSGAAADEHARAHQQWAQGATRMRDGLARMQEAAQAAHTAYSDALAANTSTLGRNSDAPESSTP